MLNIDFRTRMLIRTMVSLLLMAATSLAYAQQQVPNGGFELWDLAGERTEPKDWNSLMSADLCMLCSFGASQRVFYDKRTASGKGTCIRIESTKAIGGVIVNGSVTTGRVTAPSVIPHQGYNRTVKAEPEFRSYFSAKPDSLVFWAKYSILDKSDSALVSFLLHDDIEMTDPPRPGNANKPVALAQKAFQTRGKWQRISIPFSYSAGDKTRVKYLLATFASSFQAGKGNSTATLWIDDVELIYNDPERSVGGQTASNGQISLIR